jgi:hypothetical protein
VHFTRFHNNIESRLANWPVRTLANQAAAKICNLCRRGESWWRNLRWPTLGIQCVNIELGAQARARCPRPLLTNLPPAYKSNRPCRYPIEAPAIMALQLLEMKHMRSNKTPAVRSTCAITSFHGNRQTNTVLLSELVADYGVLESVKCRCSKTKAIGIAFCDRCWNGLPAFDQRALRSARRARTFATAYWAAAASLDIKSDQDSRPYRLYQRRK